MKHRLIAAGALVLALSLLPSLQPAFASVELVYFRAAAQANSIQVTWQTATERDTVGFRLYRSNSASPADWGQPITTQPAQGNAVTGADYQYVDSSVTSGTKYYYLLREVSSTATADYGPISAGIGVPTDTPTATATATTAAVAPTATSIVGGGGTATATGRPAPTATRRFTETPFVSPLATPTRATGATVSPLRTPTRTPLPAASVATPTGLAPQSTVAVGPMPSATATPTRAETATSTPTPTAEATEGDTQLETATPRPTKEITPIIFAAETRVDGSATPESDEQVAGQGARSTSLALIVGGSAIGLAALLAAVLLFVRSRRS